MMTHQEMFDRVARHLHQQGRMSYGHHACLYRGPNGTSCAIGCLIPDEDYQPIWDKYPENAETLISTGSIRDVPTSAVDLGQDLQSAHDHALSDETEGERWKSPWDDTEYETFGARAKIQGRGIAARLANVAKMHQLSDAVVLELWPRTEEK